MGVQQTSLDFFNLPPEEEKPGGKKNVTEKVPKVQEAQKLEEVQEVEKVQEVSKVQDVEEVEMVQKVQEVENAEGVEKVQEMEEDQEVQGVPKVQDVEAVEMVQDLQEVHKAEGFDEVERIEEAAEIKNAEEFEMELRAEEVSGSAGGPAMVIDENVRELDLVVQKIKRPDPVKVKKSTRGRMKLSEMDVLVDLVDVPEDQVLFQKRYYNIGAVSEMFKVNISLIRFWENEFDVLKPKKNGKGDRLFRPEDIKNLQLIYHLLREKKYTIEGAKDFLKKNKKPDESFALIDSLKKIKSFLLELKSNL